MKTRMHSTLVKSSYFPRLIAVSLLMMALVNPASIAFASDVNHPVSMQKTVTASAVVVPAQVSELGFLISALAKEVPVKEGDAVKAGQTLIVLDTPDLEFAATEAQAALHSAQAYADL